MRKHNSESKKIGRLIASLFAILMACMLNFYPHSTNSTITNTAFAEDGCDPGCYCVAGQKAGLFGCWGDNQWCKVDCRC